MIESIIVSGEFIFFLKMLPYAVSAFFAVKLAYLPLTDLKKKLNVIENKQKENEKNLEAAYEKMNVLSSQHRNMKNIHNKTVVMLKAWRREKIIECQKTD